jgi:FkbM family methyltransferase
MTQHLDLSAVINSFLNFYAENKHKKELGQVTEFLLAHALSARGYNNFLTSEESGESFFINEILAKSRPKLCIDVGANVGSYSLEILKATESHVIAFEPLPVPFGSLVQNSQNFFNRIKLENLGVGELNEELVIHFNPDATEHASFSVEVDKVSYLNNFDEITVPVVTLDSYFERNNIREVDLIKIDVEGFETEVFRGATQVFSEVRPKFVQIEFNWHQLFRNVSLNYFAEKLAGYDVYQLIPNGWAKRDPKDPFSNIFAFANFVFVRTD